MAPLPLVELMEIEIEDQKSCYLGALPRSKAVNGKKWMRNWNLEDHIMLHFLSQNPLKYVGLIEHQLSLPKTIMIMESLLEVSNRKLEEMQCFLASNK